MSIRTLINPNAGETLEGQPPDREPLRLHRRLPGYTETPLVDAPGLAKTLGVGKVLVKDESERLGLPAFKVLGASWAIYRALEERLGDEGFGEYDGIEDLGARLEPLRPLSLVAATDGNHGRAVARVARMLGLGAKIFVPGDMAAARREAIIGEGAELVVVDGTYDDAVERSAEAEGLLISDSSWPGYERVPLWVIEGYSTMLWEIEDELGRRGEDRLDLVVVQAGVGALTAAVARHFRGPGSSSRPKLVVVEPAGADCVLESVKAGGIVPVAGPHDSIMAGLNCGTPSLVAWPTISGGVDLFVAVEDEPVREAMRLAARSNIVSGETGASGLGGLLQLLRDGEAEEARRALGINGQTRVLIFNTEGATDPDAYEKIMAG